MKKQKLIKYLGVAFLICGVLSSSTILGLTSCSTVMPTFTVTNVPTCDWIKDTNTKVDAIWNGFYFDDVEKPWEIQNNVVIPTEHKKDIEIDKDKSFKIKDVVHRTQSASISFHFKTSAQDGDEPWDIQVIWTIKHTNFKKISTITVKPPKSNTISIHTDFLYTSKPDTSVDVDTKDIVNDNAIQCIDNIYNISSNPPPAKNNLKVERKDIQIHLMNDLTWFQYLMYQSLTYGWINDSPSIYWSIDSSAWKVNVDLEYNYEDQIFNYINLHIEGGATIYVMGVIPFNGSIVLDYSWGQPDSSNNETIRGPKLMGAYTVKQNDHASHYSQGYDPNSSSHIYAPYTQDFLALVPSSLDSYQTYDLTVTSKYYPTMTSGQHLYFLSQPRFLGLEYTSGLDHIYMRTEGSGRIDGDSFRNWQLTLPSYTLSGMSYDFDKSEWTQSYKQVNIQQCYVDISPSQLFQNELGDTKQAWADGFMYNNDFNDVDLKNDPDAFIAERKENIQKQVNCLKKDEAMNEIPWMNINVCRNKDDQQQLLSNIPFYQVIQQTSPSGGHNRMNDQDHGWSLASYQDEENKNDRNIQIGEVDNFTRFAMSLNYMFTTDNVQTVGGDNVFFYSNEQLNYMNVHFS